MPALEQKAALIRILLLDVDGVLTDGRITYSSNGEEFKSFHIQDGLGIKLLQQAGIQVGVITGRDSPMVTRRAKELGIEHLVQGREDKRDAMIQLLATLGMTATEAAYMGDDLPDLAAIREAGLGIAPCNATAIVREHADLVTQRAGGDAAVREVAEFILSARGKLQAIQASYLGSRT
jgi:3-deoxy-D-manno-octulosonate 8-phosphate phosphatase (KDO 8-P phosphatase)